MENRNRITREIISEAMSGSGRVTMESRSGGRLYWRKPVFRKGAWFIRDSGWVEIRSFHRLRAGVVFLSTDWHYSARSKQLVNDGKVPEWLDTCVHNVCFVSYKKGQPRLWENVNTFHVQARYESDLPAHVRWAE